MALVAEIQTGARIVWSGSIGDESMSFISLLRGGFLKSAPPGILPAQTVEFTFIFEEITPDFLRAVWRTEEFPTATQAQR